MKENMEEFSSIIDDLKRNPVKVMQDFNYKLESISEINPGVTLACFCYYAFQDSSFKTSDLGIKGRESNECFIQMSLSNENFKDWILDEICLDTLDSEYIEKIDEFKNNIPSSLEEYFNREDIIPLKENLIFVIKISFIYALSDSSLGVNLGSRGLESNNFMKELLRDGGEDIIKSHIEEYINPPIEPPVEETI